MAAFFWTL